MPATQTWRELRDILNEAPDEALDAIRTFSVGDQNYYSGASLEADHLKDKGYGEAPPPSFNDN